MNKRLIRLTESDLHRIVRESVKHVLTEEQLITLGSAAYNYADHGDIGFRGSRPTHHNMEIHHFLFGSNCT